MIPTIKISTRMLDQHNRETVIEVSSDADTDYLKALGVRKEILDKCEKNGWRSVSSENPTSTLSAAPKQQPAPAQATQTGNPLCRCGIPSKIHEGISKKTNKPYVRYVCTKDKNDDTKCDLSQFFTDAQADQFYAARQTFEAQNPPRDSEAENRAAHEIYESEDVPF